jgi:aryl-alcohol dehydrogenase-like predicted oxidoreductase
MEYVRLGRTGTKVSRICLGCMTFGGEHPWMVDGERARTVLERAWDLGINFYDTADVYSKGRSEEILGGFLGGRREDAVVATKAYSPMGPGPNERGLSSKHLRHALGESLRRLGTEYVDLYQTHRWDYDTPVEETLSVLTEMVADGRVRYIGASSMWAWQFAGALHVSDARGYARFTTMQNLYNLIYREEEREMNPLCASEGVALIPWSPTAAGILSGRYFQGGRVTTTEEDSAGVDGPLEVRREALERRDRPQGEGDGRGQGGHPDPGLDRLAPPQGGDRPHSRDHQSRPPGGVRGVARREDHPRGGEVPGGTVRSSGHRGARLG